MGLSSIGSSYQYFYNIQTGKIQSANETQDDDFVKWFNGDISEDELPDSINGYDERKKTDIQRYIMMLKQGMVDGTGLHTEDDENVYQIDYTLVDAVTSKTSIAGNNVWEGRTPLNYSSNQLKSVRDTLEKYRVTKREPYNPNANSATIVSGDTFDLGKGYQLMVKENYVEVIMGQGTEEDDMRALKIQAGLEAFMRLTNQQGIASMIWNLVGEYSQDLINIIGSTGVDVSKEFVINGTKCEVDGNGKIREADNTYVMPSEMYLEQLRRYETFWEIPVNKRVGKSIEECLNAYGLI